MLKGLTSTFKEGCNNVELTYKEYVKLGNDIIPVKAELKDDAYENGNFIGTFILKEIQFETEATYEFRNKEFEYYKVVNGESIKIGTFISTDITINDTTDIVKVVGMDYGLKTQVEYTSSLDYASGEITLKDVWDECCQLSGLESGIDDFVNSDFIVDSDQFTGTGAMIRDVFKGIAMSSGTFVKVMNDDKIYLVFNEITSDIEEVDVNGSATIQDGYKLEDLEMYGNTTQSGTPTPTNPQPINVVSGRQDINVVGKNLFNPTLTINGTNVNLTNCTAVKNNDMLSFTATAKDWYFGEIRNTGQTYQERFGYLIEVEEGETYSFTISNTNITKNFITYYDENKISLGSVGKSASSFTYTIPSGAKYITLRIGIGQATIVGETYTTTIQIEKGNQATPYEAYKGQSYEINLGKNLFKDGTTYTPTTIAWRDQNGDLLNGTSDFQNNTNYIDLEANKTYVFSVKEKTNIAQAQCVYINNGNVALLSNISLTSSTTFTPTSNLRVWVRAKNTATATETLFTGQLEKGSQATTYTPYKTPIELCKIGTYQDRIYKENGTWYLHKEIGKVVLDGSESGWSYPSANRFNLDSTVNDYFKSTGNITYISNYYSAFNQTIDNGGFNTLTTNTNYGFNLSSTQSNNYTIRFKDTRYTSIADFKTWLSTHNTTVYYVLNTPTTTEITDTELISQLNAIELLEGLNNVSVSSGDLPAPLKLYYYSNEFDMVEDYTELEDKRDTHPWTCLRLGMSNIEGENVDYIDEDLVAEYGENWLILNDNPFAYNQAKREELITNIFNQIKEFGYSAFVSKTSFKPYLTCGDLIRFKNRNNELVKSIILRYNHNGEEIQLEAPSETSATVNYVYPLSAINIAKQTQIIVDKEQVQIDSLTSQTNIIQENLAQNYYTSTQTNELIQTAQTGLTNTFSEAGGNNIFRNTGLWFTAITTEQSLLPSTSLYPSEDLFMSAKVSYEFWDGIVKKAKEEKASNMSAMLLQNGYVSQEQLVPNGNYTVSFKYNKPIALSVAKVFINDVEYELIGTTDTEFVQVIEVSSQHINIKFYCSADDGCEIYDLMVNAGEVKLAYSQNQNETTTSTVNISKGITITSSDTHTIFKADSDGIRIYDENSSNTDPTTKFTDVGMETNEATIKGKSQVVGTLWQEVGSQTWITKL